MNKKTIITALLAAILGLASCNSDSDYEDKVEQVTVYVSAETGIFYNICSVTSSEVERSHHVEMTLGGGA